MFTYLAFILPALAIGTILWFLSRPLPLIFGSHKLDQKYEYDPQLVREMAHQRDQGDEYETLVEMEFQPLGVYYEQLEGLPEGFAELVFEHRSLPVFAALCQNLDQQRFVIMMTEGQGRKYLRTSSLSIDVEVREPDLRMINVEANYVEDVLRVHMQELSAWGEEGFVADNGSGLAGFSSFCRDFLAHPFFGKHFCGCGMSMLFGYLSTLTIIPVVVGTPMAMCCNLLFGPGIAQFNPWLQCISIWVLIFGGYLYRVTNHIAANPESNSLKKSSALRAAQTVDVDSDLHWSTNHIAANPESNSLEKSSPLRAAQTVDVDSVDNEDGKSFDLPFRDTSILATRALEYAPGSVLGIFVYGGLIVATCMQMPSLSIPLIVFFCVFIVVVASVLIKAPQFAAFALQVVFNRTRHSLRLEKDKIVSLEKNWVYDYKRECQIGDVHTIRVEHLKNCPQVMHYCAGRCDDEWGILIFQTRLGINLLYAAPAYRVDVLVSLASEIAATIGLDKDKVVLAEEFSMGPSIEQQEEKEMTSVRDYLAESPVS